MQIYTEEELRELEAQQHEEPEAAVFDDIDFEAFDEYYDE